MRRKFLVFAVRGHREVEHPLQFGGVAKTKDLASKLDALGVRSALVLGGAVLDPNFARAASNIVGVDVLPQQGANVYDILRRDTLIMTRDAVEHLEARLK